MTQLNHTSRVVEVGYPSQTTDLVPLLYDELRSLAGQMVAGIPSGQTYQSNALVHEAFLRLARGKKQTWESRAHFFSAACEAMRRILIEEARRKLTQRRGGQWQRLDLDEVGVTVQAEPDLLLAIHDALEKLAAIDPVKAELVKLRFFGGLSIKEVGKLMGLAERTVKWHWTSTRTWLYRELTASG